MLPNDLVKIFATRNCRGHKMGETIWLEKLKLSCKIQPFKIVVEKVLSGDLSIISLTDKIFSHCPYCTTHRMIDYTHVRHQRHRKLLLLTVINPQSTFSFVKCSSI